QVLQDLLQSAPVERSDLEPFVNDGPLLLLVLQGTVKDVLPHPVRNIDTPFRAYTPVTPGTDESHRITTYRHHLDGDVTQANFETGNSIDPQSGFGSLDFQGHDIKQPVRIRFGQPRPQGAEEAADRSDPFLAAFLALLVVLLPGKLFEEFLKCRHLHLSVSVAVRVVSAPCVEVAGNDARSNHFGARGGFLCPSISGRRKFGLIQILAHKRVARIHTWLVRHPSSPLRSRLP